MKKATITMFSFLLSLATLTVTAGGGKSAKSGIYWFKLNETTGDQIPQTTQPVSTPADPYGCLVTGPKYCSRSYSTYFVVPGSSPTLYRGMTGSELTTHRKY